MRKIQKIGSSSNFLNNSAILTHIRIAEQL
nr:MAG TPA: hypothetical protein [Caudoviricetes sp.]